MLVPLFVLQCRLLLIDAGVVTITAFVLVATSSGGGNLDPYGSSFRLEEGLPWKERDRMRPSRFLQTSWQDYHSVIVVKES